MAVVSFGLYEFPYEEELSLKIKRKSSNFKVKTYWILLYLIKCQDYFLKKSFLLSSGKDEGYPASFINLYFLNFVVCL